MRLGAELADEELRNKKLIDENVRLGRYEPKLLRRLKMKRKASAVWRGGIIDGSGTISSDSGVLSNTQYSFASRFKNGIGTNPEENSR